MENIFNDFLEKLRRRKQRYKFSQATQSQDKKNALNTNQNRFRPDITMQDRKTTGTQKKRGMYSTSAYFNECDC